jgi:hypothetical protein
LPLRTKISVIPGDFISENELSRCAELFSAHYGIWGEKGIAPGSPVRLTAARLRREYLFNTEQCYLVMAESKQGEIQADVQIWLYFTTVIHPSIKFHSHRRFRRNLTHSSSHRWCGIGGFNIQQALIKGFHSTIPLLFSKLPFSRRFIFKKP